jgi:uncharacterized protein
MFIDIRELELRPLDFREEFRPGVIDLGPDATQTAPLVTTGRAQLVEEHQGRHQTIEDIRLNGDLKTKVDVPCARCLEPVGQNVVRNFELLYRPQGSDAGREEISVTAAEAEIGYYKGGGVLLEDVLREQILLALPLKTICREDCKGLCPQCGTNLNLNVCSCEAPPEDPRWSGLKEIRDKLNH